MDLQAFYFQAAEAAAAVAVPAVAGGDDVEVEAPRLPSRAAVLLRFDVQQGVGLGAGEAHGKTLALGGAAAAGMADEDATRPPREGGGLARDLVCPECGKAFQSDKAMYGHLRAHPERGYKGASRPGTPAAAASAAAGDAKPRKAPPRKEASELSTIKWPVTAKRSRTPTIASPAASAEPAPVLLLEPPRTTEPAPVLLLEPPRTTEPAPVLLLEPPRTTEPAPLLLDPPHGVEPVPMQLQLEPRRSEEEEAAMTLLEIYERLRVPAPPGPEDQLSMQQMHVDSAVVEGPQTPRTDQIELPADHGAHASHHAPVEHIFGIIVRPQAPEGEQPNAIATAAAAASKGKKPMESEPVNSGALVLSSDKLAFPGPSKRPKKRPLQGPDQTKPPAAADAAGEDRDRPPQLRRIPSPASDRRFVCPIAMCAKTFPTHQALGGHMANHNRAVRCAAAQNMDELVAAQAVHNIMVHHQLRQVALLGEDVHPPLAKAPKTHSCSRCDLVFPTGQALGGHMRKHWLEEKMLATPATTLALPILAAVAPAAAPVALSNALEVPVAVVAAPANAPEVPAAAAPAPNREPRDFEFDLNEMPME